MTASIIKVLGGGKPYNIYITNKHLIINNSTFKSDIGFDLSFAKKSFEKDKKEKCIGISTPIFEKSSKNFISYTNSYLPREDATRLLQVSYSYKNVTRQLSILEQTIKHYLTVKDVKVYLFTNSGFINDIILTDYDTYKPKIEEIRARILEGENIQKKLKNLTLETEFFTKDHTHYKAMYLSSKSVISKDTYILYNIIFDETTHLATLQNLHLTMMILTLLGIVAIFFIGQIRTKETKLTEQDHFVKSSMHEIRTPLSVITLNNDMRKLALGNDEYSTEIESALKVLQNSYDDMSFIVTKDKVDYPIEEITLASLVNTRIAYFQTISNSNDKTIKSNIQSTCKVKMSEIELIRLIDNNLSNAVKYAHRQSVITVFLKNNFLTFHSMGEPIQDTKKVFKKYMRENTVIGGYGLGLSIVSDIAKKYNINIHLSSSHIEGTQFSYTFKCHTDVTSKS